MLNFQETLTSSVYIPLPFYSFINPNPTGIKSFSAFIKLCLIEWTNVNPTFHGLFWDKMNYGPCIKNKGKFQLFWVRVIKSTYIRDQVGI